MNVNPKIVYAFKHGDISALEQIYNCYADKVYSYILSLTRNSELAADLTQTLFIHIWDKHSNIDHNRDVGSYIYAIARNMVYHHFKKEVFVDNYHRSLAVERPHFDEYLVVEDEMDYLIIEDMIIELIAKLPESRRNIFLMRWRDGLSNKEIADQLSVSEKTVSTQIHRTVVYLRHALKNVAPALSLLLLTVFNK